MSLHYLVKYQWNPKQRNRLDSSPGCLGVTCQARWMWRSHAAGTSVCSWQCVYLKQNNVDDSRLSTSWRCVVTEVVLFSIVASEILDISQGSVATHLRCGGIFSNSRPIITNFLLWLWQWNNFENRLIFGKVKAYKKWHHFWATLYILYKIGTQ